MMKEKITEGYIVNIEQRQNARRGVRRNHRLSVKVLWIQREHRGAFE